MASIARMAIIIGGVDHSAEVFAKVKSRLGKFREDFKKLNEEGQKFKAMTRLMGEGGAWGLGFGGALGGVLGVHSKMGALLNTQDALNQIRALTGQSAGEIEAFKRQIYQIAAESAQAPEQLMAAAEAKLRRGVRGDELFKSLRAEAKYTAASFGKDMAAISDATHAFSRHMGINMAEKQEQAFAGMLAISKQGLMTMDDLAKASNSLLNEASSVGLSGKMGAMQVLAAAQLSTVDVGKDEAVSTVQSIFADLKNARTEKSFASMGLDFKALHEEALASGDYLSSMIGAVMEKTGGSETELSKIFRSSATRNVVRTLHGQKDAFAAMWGGAFENADTGGAAKDHATAMNSVSAQWAAFNAQLTQALDSHAAPFLRMLTSGLQWLTDGTWKARAAIGGFMALFAGGMALKMTVWLISAARLAKGAASSVWGFAKSLWAKTAAMRAATATKLSSMASSIAGGLKTATIASWGFVKSLWAQALAWRATPIGMIITGITLVAAGAVLLWKNWDKVVSWFKDAWAFWSGLWSKMPGWLQWCFPLIKITTIIVGNWGKVKDFFTSTWAWLKGLWKGMPGWLQWCFPLIKITTIIVGNWGKIKAFFAALWPAIKQKFSDGWQSLKGFVDKFRDAGANIVKAIWEGMKGLINKPVEAIRDMASKMRRFLPFSPAKEGPFKDLHRLKFAETIAGSLKEGPLLGQINAVFGKARAAIPKALAAGGALATAATAPYALAPAPVQVTIHIDARGAAPGAEHNIEAAVRRMIPEIERALGKSAERAQRTRNLG